MMNKVNDDSLARETIVNVLDRNFFVEASAGSGKTFSLVLRMVALIEAGVPVNEICTITFTKAAANEFFVRFQKLLSTRSVSTPDSIDKFFKEKNELTMSRCANALMNIDLCFLGTIDSFLNMVAHEMPVEIDIPSDAEVISPEVREAIVKNEYEEMLSNKTHPLHKDALLFNELFYPSYDSFALGINTFSSCRNFEIVYDKSLLDIKEDYFSSYKDDFLKIVKLVSEADVDFGDLSSQTAKERKGNHEKVKSTYNRIKGKDLVNSIASIKWLIKDVKDIKAFPNMDGSPLEAEGIVAREGTRSKLYKYTQEALDVLDGMKKLVDDYCYTVFIHFISSALESINNVLKEQGKFDYYDFLYYVTEAFKKSASTDRELVDHIFERHSHILIDESQDTNPMQTEMFFYLTGTKVNSDWRKVEPKPGSIFIVGDPKQSIYGFRGANVQAYLNNKKIFEANDEVLILTRNFRSNVELKQWFNDSMDTILNHGEDALEHNDIPILEEEKNMSFENSLDNDDILLNGEYKYTIIPKDDPEKVATLIRELVNNKKYKIIRKNNGKNTLFYDSISYSDFLIVPRTTNVDDYVEWFKTYDIPIVVEADIPFMNSVSLGVLINLVNLLKQPSDKEAFLRVFFSPIYNYSYKDVIKLFNQGFNFDISNIDNLNVESPYETVIKELNRLYLLTKDKSFSSSFLLLLNDQELKLLNKVDSDYLEYTYFIIEKIKEREEAGLLSNINQLKDYLGYITNGKLEDNRVLRFKDKVDCVKISNLHKVKGLEAPIVILVKPRAQKRKADHFIDYNSYPPKAHYQSISKSEDGKQSFPIVETHAYSEEDIARWNAFEDAEKDRLAYVAATRAKSVLIASKSGQEHGSYYDPWEKITDNIADDEEKIMKFPEDVTIPEIVREDIDYINPDINEECNKQSLNYHSPSDIVKDYKTVVKKDNSDVIVEENSKEDATLIGTMVHRLMECLISSRDGYDDPDQLVSSIVKEYNGDKYYNLLLDVLNTIYRGGFQQKNSTLDKNILKTLLASEEVMCEVPFSYSKDGVITYGIIDLLYIDSNGYHIIDYKTNKEDDISVLEQEYRSQLIDYQKALKEMGIEADAHIYHIDV